MKIRLGSLIIFLFLILVSIIAALKLFNPYQQGASYAYLGTAMVDSPSIIARSKMKELGIDSKSFMTGRETAQALIGGAVDFATMAELPFMLATKLRSDIRVIGVISIAANLGILSDRKNDVKKLNDLIGKKVGLPLGTTPQFLLEGYLQKAGLDPKEVNIVNLPPPELQLALLRGDIQAMVVWQPFLEKSRLEDKSRFSYIEGSQEFIKTHYFIASSKETLQNKPQAARLILKILIDTESMINKKDPTTIATLSKAMGLDQQVFEDLLPLFEFRVHLDRRLIDVWNQLSPWAANVGLADNSIRNREWQSFIDTSPLSDVDRSRVNLP